MTSHADARAPIPFISRYSDEHARWWLRHLRAAMPEEELVLPAALTPAQRAATRFAIIAGPEPEHLAGFDGLTWVQSTWAGVEDAVEVLPAGVHVTRLVDPELTSRMAEAVLAWTLYLHRRMPEWRRQQEARVWHKLRYRPARDVTVGLLGLGELGRASAERLLANGFRVCGWSRSRKDISGADARTGPAGLSAVLAKADICVCLLPLTPDTQGLLGHDAFAKLAERPHATPEQRALYPAPGVINFARGPIVVTDALLAALDSGALHHAVLDVFDVEPLPEESPLWGHPNLTILPHISALTEPDTASEVVAANVRRWRKTGELPPAVDRGRGY